MRTHKQLQRKGLVYSDLSSSIHQRRKVATQERALCKIPDSSHQKQQSSWLHPHRSLLLLENQPKFGAMCRQFPAIFFFFGIEGLNNRFGIKKILYLNQKRGKREKRENAFLFLAGRIKCLNNCCIFYLWFRIWSSYACNADCFWVFEKFSPFLLFHKIGLYCQRKVLPQLKTCGCKNGKVGDRLLLVILHFDSLLFFFFLERPLFKKKKP